MADAAKRFVLMIRALVERHDDDASLGAAVRLIVQGISFLRSGSQPSGRPSDDVAPVLGDCLIPPDASGTIVALPVDSKNPIVRQAFDFDVDFDLGVDLVVDGAVEVAVEKNTALPAKRSKQATARVVSPPPQVQKLREHTERQREQQAATKKLVELVFAYWAEIMGHTHTLLDAKREKRIEARLRENNGNVGELLYAIDGATRDEWIMGRDPKAPRKYDGIETVLRDRAQVERFAQAIPRYRRGETHPLLETKEE